MSLPAFAELLEGLVYTPSRNGKLRLLREWFATAPDPDRGVGLAAIAGELVLRTAKPALVRDLVAARTDPELLALSHDFVGDFAETVALIWPEARGSNQPPPDLADVVNVMETAAKGELPMILAGWLDALDASSRFALIKLVTGGLRVGASARLAKTALADWAGVEVGEVEEAWRSVAPPYLPLFRWLEGKAPRPDPNGAPVFRPLMLAHPLEEKDFLQLNAAEWRAEWKWDGIRVQAVHEAGVRRLYSRTGDDISKTFPDVLEALNFEGSIDGELLVMREGRVAPFADLQQRLNRKSVDAKLIRDFPAGIRAYDLLAEDEEDLRALPFAERRGRLEAFVARCACPAIELSPLVPFENWEQLAALRAHPPEAAVEGLMLKRWDSRYEAGRPKGPWFKWKRDPYLVDAVLMYAQRGNGKRSSYYSDYTFGVWDEGKLTPVGKAYFGFTDQELLQIDKFVRDHTAERFGPVRAVKAGKDFGLVFEVAFEGLQRSGRHKSGVAMRFPRINRIRWDKPAAEADTMPTMWALLEKIEAGRT